MSATYTYLQLKNDIVDPIRFLNVSNNLTIRNTINRAARMVLRDLDTMSTKRRAILASKMFDDEFDYPQPTDIKGNGLIDLIPQGERPISAKLRMTTEQEFDRKKTLYNNMVCFSNNSLIDTLRASIDAKDTVLKVANFDSLTEDGSWVLFGDGTNLTADTNNYINGAGSINFDISAAGGTTAGIQNTTLTDIDITDYTADGSAFVWAYITSTINLTNFILRIGSDDSNYYSMTATDCADDTAFKAGWNLIRFDFLGKSTTGTPDEDATDYVAIYMTKAAGKISETDYRFDSLSLHTGEYYEALYYSDCPWQSASGTWKANSTADDDYINAQLEDYDLFVFRGKIEVFRELKEWDLLKDAQAEWEYIKKDYAQKNPSETLKYTSRYA